MRVKPGAQVRAGEVLLELHTDDTALIPGALAALDGGYGIGEHAPATAPLVLERIGQ
jgi:thymidine phosphorylase